MKDIQKIKEFFSKPLNETKFKVGDKITYLGHPGVIKAVNKEMTGDITYTVSYDKGTGKTTASNISNKGGEIKMAEAITTAYESKDFSIENIKVGDVLNLIDGETWKVIKITSNGNVLAAPFGKTKDSYISIAIEFPAHILEKEVVSLNEAKKETDIDTIKKKLDALGIKYEMSKTDKVRPFKAIYKPINKSDKFYDEFEDIVDLFNLKGFVKSSMNENRSSIKVGDIVQKSYASTDEDYIKEFEVVSIDKNGKAILKDTKTGKLTGMYVGDLHKVSMNEATKDEETEFHKKLDKLVHDTFGKRKEEIKEGKGSLNIKKQKDGKYYWTFTFESGKIEKSFDGFNTPAEAQKDFMYRSKFFKETTIEEVNLKQSKLSSSEYQKAKKLKDFKASDWKWNADEDLYTKVNEGKLTEAKSFTIDSESASDSDKITDFLTKNNISFKKVGSKIKISLDRDTPKASSILSKLKSLAKFNELNEGKLNEVYIPSNVKAFAERKGVLDFVEEVAGWAEKVGARVTGGTAIGKDYNTIILDLGYQTADIYIDTENGTVELYGEPVRSFSDFKDVFMDQMTKDEMEKDENQFRREQGLEERIAEALNKINEELCPAGKAYIKKRKAAGEKSSAYLSGRAVKVCKGQMSGKAKKKK